MNIIVDCSIPFFLAHGGLTIQVRQTVESLRRLGVTADYARWWEDDLPGDLIHFFGKPTPLYAALCRQKNRRYVISDLLTAQGSYGAGRRMITRLALGADRLAGGMMRRRLGWGVYDSAAAVIALTEWEASLLVEMYGVSKSAVHVVPNGVEEAFLEPAAGEVRRGGHLICTATVTERKRVLELARAAVKARVPVRFVGAPYEENNAYCRAFRELVASHKDLLEDAGPVDDRRRLAGEYRQAAGFVLLSAMESQSLSALEAAACGLPLLLSDLPWARCSFGESATYCALEPEEETARQLGDWYRALDRAPRPMRPLSWLQVAERLRELYSQLAGAR